MINKETIISSFDDKATLLKWLKKVEDALNGAALVSVSISQPTETTAAFTFNFEDGTAITSPSLELPRGASVVNAMLTAENHLILVLDNGRNIDVGNIMPHNVNAENGTFSVSLSSPSVNAGTINTGNLYAVGDVEVSGDIKSDGNLRLDNGNATISGDLDVGGDASANNLDAGNLHVGENVQVDGSVTATSFSGENARPIYQHSIIMFGNGGEYHLALLIFNNRPNPYYSVAEFLADVRNWGMTTARLMCSGACIISSEACVVSYITVTVDNANLICNKCSNGDSVQLALETLTTAGNFNDGIYKIN